MLTHENYIANLPASLEVAAGEEKTILVDTLADCEITVEKDATLTLVAYLTKGWEENKKLKFVLNGENSKVLFLSIIFAENDEQFPYETESHHIGRSTEGFYHTKSVLGGKAKINYTGNLIIPKSGQLADTYLSHDSLLLSKDATVGSVPCLEIEADDVAAGHSATMGRVDEDMLFYLRSRGLTPENAKRMLVQGFLASDLDKLDSEELRLLIQKEIEKSL
jgi:Fe-S cluster assembly scaffold protein SufB